MGPLVITLEKSSAKDAIHTKITTKQSKSKASYHQSICGAFTSHEKEHEVKQKWLASTRPPFQFNICHKKCIIRSDMKVRNINAVFRISYRIANTWMPSSNLTSFSLCAVLSDLVNG
ncbi:hypothetical protein GQX74_002157 [Glossina fuscipes]|nr:hypothetical protein GQX74_002157 [Glossina fuscipes]